MPNLLGVEVFDGFNVELKHEKGCWIAYLVQASSISVAEELPDTALSSLLKVLKALKLDYLLQGKIPPTPESLSFQWLS